MTPPLAIVQARMGSTRLPGKMLLPLGGRPLVWWAWNAAVQAFGHQNVVCAIPADYANDRLAQALIDFGATVYRHPGPESDVLGRFYDCAYRYRDDPAAVIVRVTPDDPFKDPEAMRRVAAGERLPVELGGEAFTLGDLARAHWSVRDPEKREHLTHALFDTPPPPAPEGLWTIDTPEDYERAKAILSPEPALMGAPFEP